MSKPFTTEKALVLLALVALIGAVFARTFALFVAGWHDEENQHGWLVAPLAAYVIWLNWGRLARVPVCPDRRAGLLVLVPALLLQVAGIWLGLERSVGYAFPLALVGLSLYFGGRVITRALAFPLAFLVFMVPTPGGLLDILSAPLQVTSARMAVLLAGLSGVSVQNEGVNLLIPSRHIAYEVAVACSGLHSLTAMCMLAALLAYFMRLPVLTKWGLFLLGMPLALLGNIVRIYLVLMVANAYGQNAGAAFHDGWIGKLVPFTVAFLVLIVLGRLLERRVSRNAPPPSAPAVPA